MPADDPDASGAHQARFLETTLTELRVPVSVAPVSITHDRSVFSLASDDGQPIALARLRSLACDIADELDVHRIDVEAAADPSRALLTTYPLRDSASPPALPRFSEAAAELITTQLLLRRQYGMSPSRLANQLRISWTAAARILAKLEYDEPPAPS